MSADDRAAPEPGPSGEPADMGAPDRKARDAGLILPLAGAVALMPPVAWVVVVEGAVLGVPAVVAYVFAVWAALILAARGLARRLGPRAGAPPDRRRPG